MLRQSLSGDFVKRCKARRAEKQWGGAAWAVQKKINEDQRRGRWARARFQCRCALGGNVRCTGDVRGDYAQMLCKELQVLRAKKRRFGVFVEDARKEEAAEVQTSAKNVQWHRRRRATSTEARTVCEGRAGGRRIPEARRLNEKCLLSTSSLGGGRHTQKVCRLW